VTKQKLLDEIDRRSRSNLFPSRDPGSGFCRYRTPDGTRRCFAGLGIPDEKYREDIEGSMAASYCVRAALDPAIGLSVKDWADLQYIHDGQGEVWDHDEAMADVLALPCFAGMSPSGAQQGVCHAR